MKVIFALFALNAEKLWQAIIELLSVTAVFLGVTLVVTELDPENMRNCSRSEIFPGLACMFNDITVASLR